MQLPQGLTSCSYAELHCRQHGDFRIAVERELGKRYPCPLCGNPSTCAVLGRGGTRLPLTIYELVGCELSRWLRRARRGAERAARQGEA